MCHRDPGATTPRPSASTLYRAGAWGLAAVRRRQTARRPPPCAPSVVPTPTHHPDGAHRVPAGVGIRGVHRRPGSPTDHLLRHARPRRHSLRTRRGCTAPSTCSAPRRNTLTPCIAVTKTDLPNAFRRPQHRGGGDRRGGREDMFVVILLRMVASWDVPDDGPSLRDIARCR
jgi:hypothetical protein